MLRYFCIIYDIVFDAIEHFMEEDGWAMASHISLSTLLSIFPFIFFGANLAGFLGAHQFVATVMDVLFSTWPEVIAKPITDEILQVLSMPKKGLFTISALVSAYFSSNGIEALRVSLNRAYRVVELRSWYVTRLISLGYVLLSAFILTIVSFVFVNIPLALAYVKEFSPSFGNFLLIIWNGRVYGTIFVIFLGLIFVHLFLPAGNRMIYSILPGIIFTWISWLVGAFLFAHYIIAFSNYSAIYAGLASITIFLVFLYILGVIFIFGAELNASIMINYWRKNYDYDDI
ncbi:YihY/virulence factor BrkB family protein [Candidatus Liberibacter americanus]|uniref:Putative multitransmembrane protein n=1 Tax=Candidatus Liberibacter americanus str. Sao Paulo TaxID=1261131 RepID=U6B7B9_9HYPH|nr:YihY/virulence factor BrkB family protein [Candidatus Liberibacter americanus]AHA27652.1 putative multitransmembrane protein [Candidatus Liberibacter americanus str. Sao Paulo]EMS36361.1 ribonuclease protein [Candidatus Liberibacter americanus PW_SP]